MSVRDCIVVGIYMFMAMVVSVAIIYCYEVGC